MKELYYKVITWFHPGWYSYLFEDFWSFRKRELYFWQLPICRAKGHPKGPVWYTTTRFEPDMSCDTCGDNLG